MATKPTHEQAQLHLQLFEMRREARLRQARDWFFKHYHIESYEDALKIASPESEGVPPGSLTRRNCSVVAELMSTPMIYPSVAAGS